MTLYRLLADFRFRHAVVSAMTGGGTSSARRQIKKPGMADVVAAQMKISKAMKQGKVPEGKSLRCSPHHKVCLVRFIGICKTSFQFKSHPQLNMSFNSITQSQL